ncbi:MBL fold metallo-hydrolase [Wenxinia saemankumensis]|uniref:Glyoxylase, beta-lactamase superfamily II n=1 Tax=Wenxinia saemankumensis TaxID=1447782 RepID=A0A1M6E8H0_9RHOB|nr:MBL fold metallo-hydrolase [Wenxinia saemankumensis]SHI81797.1 Glyoxylase, beta-lactamase superfamily II [Wenxinia saemankumensis]
MAAAGDGAARRGAAAVNAPFQRDGLRFPWDAPPEPGRATEVAEGILWMRLPLPMALDHVNVYALADEDGWTIVDAGLSWQTGRALWGELLAGPLAGRPVARVLVTHAHPDHVGLTAWLARDGATILMPRTAWLMARMLTLDVQDRPSAEARAFWRLNGMDPAEYARRLDERPFNFADCVDLLPPGHTRLVEGGILRLAGRSWDIRMGDGHAPEHATLWAREEPLVIAGDQLLPGISPNIGVHPTEPEADPLGEWIASCRRLAPHARENQLVLPGHKLPYRGLPTRLDQLEANHHGALARLEAHLAEPRRGGECFPPLFRREIGRGVYGLAFAETVAHLNHLVATGRARRWLAEDGAWRWQANAAA